MGWQLVAQAVLLLGHALSLAFRSILGSLLRSWSVSQEKGQLKLFGFNFRLEAGTREVFALVGEIIAYLFAVRRSRIWFGVDDEESPMHLANDVYLGWGLATTLSMWATKETRQNPYRQCYYMHINFTSHMQNNLLKWRPYELTKPTRMKKGSHWFLMKAWFPPMRLIFIIRKGLQAADSVSFFFFFF